MKLSQVAAQLYTIRDHCKTEADFAASMKRIRSLGYLAVQLSGVGPIAPDIIVRILKENGLTCCATHEGGEMILKTPEQVVAKLKALNCRFTAYPYPGGIKFDTMDEVRALCAGLDQAGKLLRENGQVLTYHNHDIEFNKVVDGKRVMDWLYELTAANNLQGEIDTYWVKAGNDDPAAWCRKLKNRLPLLHMKDGKPGADGKLAMTEIGNGVLDWPGIIAAAEAAGCLWFIVEQDGNWQDGDPFKSLTTSFQFISGKLCQG